MVGLMGVFMTAAAFRPEWRTPILLYSALEKAFMVYLVLANISRPYSEGFWTCRHGGRNSGSLHDRLFRRVRLRDARVLRMTGAPS